MKFSNHIIIIRTILYLYQKYSKFNYYKKKKYIKIQNIE